MVMQQGQEHEEKKCKRQVAHSEEAVCMHALSRAIGSCVVLAAGDERSITGGVLLCVPGTCCQSSLLL